MDLNKSFTRSFVNNPIAWMLGVLLAVSVFSYYRASDKLSSVCSTILMLEEGYSDIETLEGYEATGFDNGAMTVKVEKHDFLMKVDSPDGRAYRWWKANMKALDKVCWSL